MRASDNDSSGAAIEGTQRGSRDRRGWAADMAEHSSSVAGISDVGLLSNLDCVIDFDTKISNRALNF
jgi:hypothetical protein